MLNPEAIRYSLCAYLFALAIAPAVFASALESKNTGELNSSAANNFVTPSGNIHCAVTSQERKVLRCEIQSGLKPLPRQPYPDYCKFDWGLGFSLSQNGKPKILCVSDTIGSSNYVLSYGRTWRYLGFKCLSKETGLTCSNSAKKGFSLNRNKWSIFEL
jgi:hypothetical protein